MSETRTITIEVFRTPKGVPTCARYFPSGQVCRFLMSKSMGMVDVCSVTDEYLFRAAGTDFLKVSDKCICWN